MNWLGFKQRQYWLFMQREHFIQRLLICRGSIWWQHFLHRYLSAEVIYTQSLFKYSLFTCRGSILYSGRLCKVTEIQRLFRFRGYLYAEAVIYALCIYKGSILYIGNIYKTVIALMQKLGMIYCECFHYFFTKMWINTKNKNVNHCCSNYHIKVASQTFLNEDKITMFLFYFHCFALYFFHFAKVHIYFVLCKLRSDYTNLVNVKL